MTPQKKATLISSSVAAILTLIKLVVGVASGSVAVLASAIDSVLDMFVSIFNFFAITNSEKPTDEKFNYGRGKIEALASVIEGVIISLSGVFLFYQAVKKAIHEETSQYLEISLIVMLISTIITISLVLFLNKTATEPLATPTTNYNKSKNCSNTIKQMSIQILLFLFHGYQ